MMAGANALPSLILPVLQCLVLAALLTRLRGFGNFFSPIVRRLLLLHHAAPVRPATGRRLVGIIGHVALHPLVKSAAQSAR
jgi:hypothetical protein